MKQVVWLIFVVSILNLTYCKKDNNKEMKKDNEVVSLILFGIQLSQQATYSCFAHIPSGGCTAVTEYFNHNIQSIKVYYEGNFIFETTMNKGLSITGDGEVYEGFCNTFMEYQVNLRKGQSVEWFGVYKKDGNYCGVELGFPDGSTKQYEMFFDGDLNTFTELKVGEYTFVPVRQ